ncbi:hypothetical protein CHS0354_006995 [Potamilus streckersoni]|uniref:DUF4614 domain-containing protein n=1 Tax=Potamilus streckersoni TaxID=2493646 RepID=A0AAE0RWQ7_9BIVA|nr:hypothetical protein CHS0354_006995 [Potamilus streckersoni]
MRRTPSATSALLQRATSQLKGERVKKPESDIDAYISSLTEKTAKQKKSVNFEDIGEISISSNIDSSFEPAEKPSSRFLKKPSQSFDEESANDKGSKFLKKPQQSAASPSPAPSVQEKFIHGSHTKDSVGKINPQSSAALSKASAVASKITQRTVSARKVMTLESDSDESLALVRVGKGSVDKSDSSGSVKIGRDGGKFLKKSTGGGAGTPLTAPPLTSVQPQPENIIKHSKTTSKAAEPTKKASPYQLRSSLKYSTNVVLTSEEESLAEYIDGLQSSSADSAEKPKSKQYQKHEPKGKRNASPPPKSQPDMRSPSPLPHSRPGSGKLMRPLSPDSKPPAVRRTPSPSPRTPQRSGSRSPSPNLRRRSPSPRTSRSLSDDSNIAESLKSEIAEDQDSDGGFNVNIVMDLDELGPVTEDPPSTRKSRKDQAVSSKSTKTKKGLKDKTTAIDTSPFKSSQRTSGSPFKKSESKSPSSLKGREKPTKSKQYSSSPNKKSREESPSSFKASGKTGVSPFRASEPVIAESPFKATSKTEDSVFKATARSSSPFKALEKGRSTNVKDVEKKKTPDSPIKSSLKNKDQSLSELSDHRQKKKKKTVEFKKDDDFFSALGLQTVEDLLGPAISKKDKDEESVASEVSEAKYDFTEEIKTEMSEKVPVFGNKFRAVDSASEVASEVESWKTSYSEDFESISEKIGASSRIDKTKSASEIETHYTGEETGGEYTEEFDSDTESVATVSRTSETSEKTITDSYSYSDEESYTKSVVPSTSSKFEKPKKSIETKSAGAQTMTDALHYQWNMYGSGFAIPDTALGLGFVDPTPIATHVVSSDALEAMTAYSPAMLALHDMLKQQLQLTQEFIENQKYLYKYYVENIESSYRYTTLKDTKKYIRKHRKKKLTFKEALRMVDAEMPYNR